MEDFYKAIGGTEYRTLKAIANDLGVSKERVRQVLKERALTHIPSRRKPDRRKNCAHCNKKVEATRDSKRKGYYRVHCSDSCRYNEGYVFVDDCSWCKEPVILLKTDPRIRRNSSGHWYCNHHCFGKYASRNYGWAKGKNIEERKEKFLKCYATKVYDNRSILEACEESGITRGSVYSWRRADILFKNEFEKLRSQKKK